MGGTKPKRTLKTKSRAEAEKDTNVVDVDEKKSSSNSDSSSKSKRVKLSAKKVKKFEDWHWFFHLALALLFALGIRFVIDYLFAGNDIGFIWLEIIKDFAAFLVLLAIASVTKRSKAGIAVAIFIILISLVKIVNHDYPDKPKDRYEESGVVLDDTRADYRLLYPNKTYAFELEAGEETPWRGFPEGRNNGYGIYSKNYDHTVIFTDGTSYRGDEDLRIPEKRKHFFKIKAHSKQIVYVTVF